MAAKRESYWAWRNIVLLEADKIEDDLGHTNLPAEDPRVGAVRDHVVAARAAANRSRRAGRLWAGLSGVDIEEAWGHLHAARQSLMFVASPAALRAEIPTLQSKATRYLEKGDMRREAYLNVLKDFRKNGGDPPREFLHDIREAVDAKSDQRYSGVRSFRNILFAMSLALTIALIAISWTDVEYDYLPLCPASGSSDSGTSDTAGQVAADQTTDTEPDASAGSAGQASVASSRCPSAPQIAAVGALGGLISGAIALRSLRRKAAPYALPISQALLKVPMGAVLAITGVMLLQSKLIDAMQPIPAPDVLTYALIFGFAQQLITRLIDKRADSIVAAPVKEPPTEPPDTT